MKRAIGLLFFILAISSCIAQVVPSVTAQELNEMYLALEEDKALKSSITSLGDPKALLLKYKKELQQSDSVWLHEQASTKKFKNAGSTNGLIITPIVEAFSKNPAYKTENAVSYLIETDKETILFDLGLNSEKSGPPAIMSNMDQLGIQLADIDKIVISHNHGDHNGGLKSSDSTFRIGVEQPPLNNIRVYVPTPMKYPTCEPVFIPRPARIGDGIISTGVIESKLFFGNIEEQALIIKVEGKGLVIITGCGHQTIKRIIERTEALCSEPIYAIIGGFHLPMTTQENIGRGYKYFVTGKLPWQCLTEEDITNDINLIKKRNIKLISISRHDTCLESIRLFKTAFPLEFVDMLVGEPIKI